MGDLNGISPIAVSYAQKPTAIFGGTQPGETESSPEITPPVGTAMEAAKDDLPGREAGLPKLPSQAEITEDTPAGPPPAFAVSLFEKDRALQESLARQNAAQGFEEAERATGGQTAGETAKAEPTEATASASPTEAAPAAPQTAEPVATTTATTAEPPSTPEAPQPSLAE